MKLHGSIILLLTMILLIFSGLWAQNIDEMEIKINTQNKDLNRLDKEIRELQKTINVHVNRETSLLDELDLTDKQISLVQQSIEVLNNDLELRKEKLKTLESQQSESETVLDSLIERYKRRVIRGYKYHSDDWLHIMFESKGMNQFFYRLKYMTAINQSERKLHHQIKELISNMERQKTAIASEKQSIEKNIAGQRQREKSLSGLKTKRKEQLAAIRKDKKLLTQSLKEKEASREKLKEIIGKLQEERQKRIAELERQRAMRRQTTAVTGEFSKMKGNLPWPASGEIVGRFGKYKDPDLKIITENTGVDIKTKKNNNVQAVTDGLVTTITWLRGFGNMIIIHHGEDYYTVYAHVDLISVQENEYVEAGQSMAIVSDGGTWNDSILHFEIWDSKTKLNPEQWLRK